MKPTLLLMLAGNGNSRLGLCPAVRRERCPIDFLAP
jgi:hypothetical protein